MHKYHRAELRCKAIGATKEAFTNHLNALSHLDIRLSKLHLDKAVLQQLGHDDHVRLLALLRDDHPRLPSSQPEDPSGPLAQGLQQRAEKAREMRKHLENDPK